MDLTDRIYGGLPVDLGLVDLSPEEMLFWMYCPIKVKGRDEIVIPDNLLAFRPIVDVALRDCADRLADSYVYLTAKTLWVTPEAPGNRPGWHSDGFLTTDLNYVWSDTNPTVFFHDGATHAFTKDHVRSLSEMDALCERDASHHRRFPDKTVLRLDQGVLHKVDTGIQAGMRSFVKVSVSDRLYALRGNAINHKLGLSARYEDRGQDRNCPIGGEEA